ncbi:MAG TPA: riboflavin synthase [Methylomirabilota bacterium]|nr:riboflavin synthase [Methylomirabilota bacterium]
MLDSGFDQPTSDIRDLSIMFTGIVEELGTVMRFAPREGTWRLEICARQLFASVKIGESVAVNGVCLTVVEPGNDWCAFDVGPETLKVSNLKELRSQDPVNLERPLRLGAPVGGHLVSGHVDGIGVVQGIVAERDSIRMAIGVGNPELERYLIPKGSIAMDGVSLTVAELREGSVEVMLIPHTLRLTTLGTKREGATVNLEMDMIGKYLYRVLSKISGTESESLDGLLIHHGLLQREPLQS